MVATLQRPAKKARTLSPQEGPQTEFFLSDADIVIYGGAAGGGKTWALLLEPLRHYANPQFRAVTFRRTSPQITNPGGLWEESSRMYAPLGATPRQSDYTWVFPTGMTVRFAHLVHADTVYDWQGSQIPLICFDELTHFLESQFWYMVSRLRSLSGVKGYVRATCNPDASSWVKKLLAPWVDRRVPDEIKAEPGEVMYFFRDGESLVWARTKQDLMTHFVDEEEADRRIRSMTFISAKVYDNKALLEADPTYLAWLESLPPVDKARLLHGDWDVIAAAGKIFSRDWFRQVDSFEYTTPEVRTRDRILVSPAVKGEVVRFWDFAATEKSQKKADPDYTVGLKMLRLGTQYIVIDVIRRQMSPAETDTLLKLTSFEDAAECERHGVNYYVRWEEEGGASGKRDSYHNMTLLDGLDARGVRPVVDKVRRAKGLATQVFAGNVSVLNRYWMDEYLVEMHQFPQHNHDDMVDASSGAYTSLLSGSNDIIETESIFDV